MSQTSEERETVINLNAADRKNGGTWEAYSDDPAMITKLRRAAAPHKDNGRGGYFFRIPFKLISFRRALDDDSVNVPDEDDMPENVEVMGRNDGKQGTVEMEAA